MRLGRRSKTALATLRWHDIDEVEYSAAKGRKYVSEFRKQIHPENDVYRDADCAKQKDK